MKLRKVFAGLLAGVLGTAAMVTAASAATFNLPKTSPWQNNANQWGWGAENSDAAVEGLTMENLASAKSLVIKVENDLEDGGMFLVWQGKDNGWGWNQSDDIALADVYDASTKTITLDLSLLKDYGDFKEETQGKILVGLYAGEAGTGWDAAGISSISLTGTKEGNPAAAPTTATKPVATGDGKEADTGAEGVAVLFGIAVIATGAAVLSKKKA